MVDEGISAIKIRPTAGQIVAATGEIKVFIGGVEKENNLRRAQNGPWKDDLGCGSVSHARWREEKISEPTASREISLQDFVRINETSWSSSCSQGFSQTGPVRQLITRVTRPVWLIWPMTWKGDGWPANGSNLATDAWKMHDVSAVLAGELLFLWNGRLGNAQVTRPIAKQVGWGSRGQWI